MKRSELVMVMILARLQKEGRDLDVVSDKDCETLINEAIDDMLLAERVHAQAQSVTPETK